MIKNPLVSIVMPIYNQEDYLDKSITDVQRQSYFNIEIIAVNDGSNDESQKIIEQYASKDPRIKIIQQKNQGLVGATVTGIKNALGDYICFLDPDDSIGTTFISCFLNNMDNDYDFIAAGFYYDQNIKKRKYTLKENKIYNKEELDAYKNSFLTEEHHLEISNRFFISRWNKMYSAKCLQKVVESYALYKNVTLGEDTIFTLLVLENSCSGKTLSQANLYYYNIANEKSMMKNNAVEAYVNKCYIAFDALSKLLVKNGKDKRQAYLLFYYLINSLYERTLKQDKQAFNYLYGLLYKDGCYKKTLKIIRENSQGIKIKLDMMFRQHISSPQIYSQSIDMFKELKQIMYGTIDDMQYFMSNICRCGIYTMRYQLKFRKNRRNAHKDILRKLPIIEERVIPILKPYLQRETNLKSSSIEKNLFIFWWDGFENGPIIVKKCLESVRRFYSDCNIILVTKNNYMNYTDIHPIIIKDFFDGKISVQTFSDILRFNLLKNNGGMWIDATIFFTLKCDLISRLEEKSFESLCFATSKDFLKYKETTCSWSGYFIASRKGSLFTEAVNAVFEKYYLKYHEYTTYFFIDAVLMICKINHLDNDVLNNIYYINGDMFALLEMLNERIDSVELEGMLCIPQKLTWFYRPSCENKDTFFNKIVIEQNWMDYVNKVKSDK